MANLSFIIYHLSLIAAITVFFVIAWRNLPFALALLFGLLPTYLIRFRIGPIPSTLLEMMVFVILGVWIIKEYRIWNIEYGNKKTQKFSPYLYSKFQIPYSKSFFIALILFLLGATISIFTSIHPRAALGEWKAFYIETILLFFVLITSIENKKDVDRLLACLIFSGLVTSLLAIYQHWTGFLVPDAFWANRNTYRVTAWYGFPNAVGMFLAPLVPLALYNIKQSWDSIKQQKRNKTQGTSYNCHLLLATCSFIFIPCSLLAILFAKSLGPLIAVGVGVLTILVMQKRWRWLTATILASGVLALTLYFLLPNLQKQIQTKLYSSNLRINIWAETIEFLRAYPIQGAGLASYADLIRPYRIDKWVEVFHHPHNIFLTMWVNLGILGLIGFVGIIIWFYQTASQNLKPNTYNLTPYLLSAMTVWLTLGFVDSPYIKNDLAVMFWLLPALLIINQKKTQ